MADTQESAADVRQMVLDQALVLLERTATDVLISYLPVFAEAAELEPALRVIGAENAAT